MIFRKHVNGIKLDLSKAAAGRGAVPMSIPGQVGISLRQYGGASCRPLVRKGDRVYVGQLIGDDPSDRLCVPVHSSVSGAVAGIVRRTGASGGTFEEIVIDPDGMQTPCPDLCPPQISDVESFIAAARASGAAGMGGSGIPLVSKLTPPVKPYILIINGAESEPYLTCDQMAMLDGTADILDGMRCIMRWMDIHRAIIAVGADKRDAAARLSEMTAQQPNISVFLLRDSYPQGAEHVIVGEALGREAVPGIPVLENGVLMLNCTTVMKFNQYLRTGMPVVSRCITVDGDLIDSPRNVEVPIGARVRDVIDFCGGDPSAAGKILLGGVMTGVCAASADESVSKTDRAVLVFSPLFAGKLRETACIHCGRCVRACSAQLSPHLLLEACRKGDLKAARKLGARFCIACGACSYACPARRPLADTIIRAKAELERAYSKDRGEEAKL